MEYGEPPGVVLDIGTLGVEDGIIVVSLVKGTGVSSVGTTVGVVGICVVVVVVVVVVFFCFCFFLLVISPK